MEEPEEGEGNAGSNEFLRSWIKPSPKKLEVLRDGSCAATVFDRDVVNPVGVNDPQAGVSS